MIEMQFRLELIGPFRLLAPDGRRVDIKSRKSCATLAILGLSRGNEVSREYLATLLWGDRGPEQAKGSLRQELSSINKTLNIYGESPVLADRRSVYFKDRAISIDLLDDAEHLCGELLEGFDLRDSDMFEDWLREARRSFTEGSLAEFLRVPNTMRRRDNGVNDATRHDEHTISQITRGVSAGQRNRNRQHQYDKTILSIAPPNVQLEDYELKAVIDEVIDNCINEIQSIFSVNVMDFRGGDYLSGLPLEDSWCCLQAFARRVPEGVTFGFHIKRTGIVVASLKMTVDFDQHLQRRTVCAKATEAVVAKLRDTLRFADTSKSEEYHINQIRSLVFDGLFIPGSVSLEHMKDLLAPVLGADPSGIDFALSNCVHMLEFGERETGNAPFGGELVSEYFRRSIELDPVNGLIQCVAGHVNSLWLGNHSASLEHSKRSIEFLTASPICWTFHALALMRAGYFDEAKKACSRARLLGSGGRYSGFIEAIYTISLVLTGDFEAAKLHGDMAVILNPKFKATYKYLFAAYVQSGDFEVAADLANVIRDFDNSFYGNWRERRRLTYQQCLC